MSSFFIMFTNVHFIYSTRSFSFGIGALLAPQLVHFMEVWTNSGNGVFYVAFALATTMAITNLSLPKGAEAPRVASKNKNNSNVPAAQAGSVGPDMPISVAVTSEAGSADGGLPATSSQDHSFSPPIIWDEAARDDEEEDDGVGGEALNLAFRRGGKWRLAFQAALLALIFSNVSIELGKSQNKSPPTLQRLWI